MKQFLSRINWFFKRLEEHRIPVYSGQAAMFIIISALPFLMLLVSLLQFVTPYTQAQYVELSTTLLPSKVSAFLNGLINEIFSSATIPIVSITSLTTLWSASMGVMALLRGLENIYSTSKMRGYLKARILSYLYTLCFIILIWVTLFLFVAGKALFLPIEQYFPIIYRLANMIRNFPMIVYFFILVLVFLMFYKWLPGKKIKFKNQIYGAVFSAAGWIIFSAVYAFYVDNFLGNSYIYGSLTAIVFLMLWMYFCINILLIGAEINKIIEEKSHDKL